VLAWEQAQTPECVQRCESKQRILNGCAYMEQVCKFRVAA